MRKNCRRHPCIAAGLNCRHLCRCRLPPASAFVFSRFGFSWPQKPFAGWFKKFVNNSSCCLPGCLVPSSHEQTKSDAIPIFAARWPGVRFFSWHLNRIQSPSVFMLSTNGLACCGFLNLWLNCKRICRCAIPSSATLLRGEGGIVRRHFENSCGWICRTAIRKIRNAQSLFLLPGEKVRMRASHLHAVPPAKSLTNRRFSFKKPVNPSFCALMGRVPCPQGVHSLPPRTKEVAGKYQATCPQGLHTLPARIRLVAGKD